MSLNDDFKRAAESLNEALAQLSDTDRDIRQDIREWRTDVARQLHALTNEIRIERQTTRDQLEALHKRIDEGFMGIRQLLGTNGSGGPT